MWKYERREEKLNNRRRQAKAVKVDIPNLSKKDIIIVSGYVNNDQNDTFKIKLSGKGLVGGPKEFKLIKELCSNKLETKTFKILEIVSG